VRIAAVMVRATRIVFRMGFAACMHEFFSLFFRLSPFGTGSSLA